MTIHASHYEQSVRKTQSMAGFRNIAVHDYLAIDPAVLKAILKKHLKYLEDFYVAVLLRFGVAGKPTRRKVK
ncbi:MAG TPA: HepT-like ribonuclease domain-containing protein [Dissulfurispiraceae bacterium]|nr:HepT-like ribonuclease domain-containing protein [Dissulfurispiraceae bacterium]